MTARLLGVSVAHFRDTAHAKQQLNIASAVVYTEDRYRYPCREDRNQKQ